jgi:uncharacterized protein (DUF1778 family)
VKKAIKESKEEIIHVRCTAQQKEALESIAARDGLGVSTWLLSTGLRAAREQKAEEEKR